MNCPHCHEPIDPALVRAAANKDAAGRARPRAKGQAKTGCTHGHVVCSFGGHEMCVDCRRSVRWDAKQQKWRIRYTKQKRVTTTFANPNESPPKF